MADDDDVVCPLPALRKVRRRRQLHKPRAHNTDTKHWTRTHALLVAALPLPHTRDPSCRAPLTRDRPQACEPRCADVFKHYLACADRIEQKGAGVAPASSSLFRASTLWTPTRTPHDCSPRHAVTAPIHAHPRRETHAHAIAATAQKNTAGDCEPYYFDWLKCIDKCAMPHIMQKLK